LYTIISILIITRDVKLHFSDHNKIYKRHTARNNSFIRMNLHFLTEIRNYMCTLLCKNYIISIHINLFMLPNQVFNKSIYVILIYYYVACKLW
jgi:hypothetical protein